MAATKTSLSASEVIRTLLNTAIGTDVTKIFPVVVDKATLPYVVFRRNGLVQEPTKALRGADTAQVEVLCYTADYTSGVELAEKVRAALDFAEYSDTTIRMRSCTLTDAEELWADDAYVQQLVFTVKI